MSLTADQKAVVRAGLAAAAAAAVLVSLFLVHRDSPSLPAVRLPAAAPESETYSVPHVSVEQDRAPRLGLITLGAFAPESMPYANISITDLDSDSSYSAYRSAVRSCYGVDLADMNYLGVGMPGWTARYRALADWLSRAGRYGDPTIAIEPIGKAGFGVFQDSAEMRDLRSIFASAGVTVWVRFASESNLKYSVYSVYNNPVKIAQYRRSARWFRSYMPPNVRLVFSPLINTAYLQNTNQLASLRAMYEPGAYDRIGGTLYATSWLRPKIAFDWYYRFMRRLDPKTPFQICELGSIYPRKEEVRAFLIRVAKGEWPGVQRVNLFAGDLNPLAVNEHGHFGFILPGESSSYLSDLLAPSGASLVAGTDEAALEHLEELGAGWQSPEMTLEGSVLHRPNGLGDFYLSVNEVTDNSGVSATLRPVRPKRIVLTDGCTGAAVVSALNTGEELQITGWDSGAGTALRATSIEAPSRMPE